MQLDGEVLLLSMLWCTKYYLKCNSPLGNVLIRQLQGNILGRALAPCFHLLTMSKWASQGKLS